MDEFEKLVFNGPDEPYYKNGVVIMAGEEFAITTKIDQGSYKTIWFLYPTNPDKKIPYFVLAVEKNKSEESRTIKDINKAYKAWPSNIIPIRRLILRNNDVQAFVMPLMTGTINRLRHLSSDHVFWIVNLCRVQILKLWKSIKCVYLDVKDLNLLYRTEFNKKYKQKEVAIYVCDLGSCGTGFKSPATYPPPEGCKARDTCGVYVIPKDKWSIVRALSWQLGVLALSLLGVNVTEFEWSYFDPLSMSTDHYVAVLRKHFSPHQASVLGSYLELDIKKRTPITKRIGSWTEKENSEICRELYLNNVAGYTLI